MVLGCAEDGSIGPVGDNGKVGTQGASGDKGLAGDKGATGPIGVPSSSKGIGNLFFSQWKKGVWKYEGTVDGDRIFECEVPFNEITESVINISLIRVHRRLNSTPATFGRDEYPNGAEISYTDDNIQLVHSLRGFKVGKLLIRGVVKSSLTNEDAVKALNALSQEFRITIIN